MLFDCIRASNPTAMPFVPEEHGMDARVLVYNWFESRWELTIEDVEDVLALAEREGCPIRLIHGSGGDLPVLEICDTHGESE